MWSARLEMCSICVCLSAKVSGCVHLICVYACAVYVCVRVWILLIFNHQPGTLCSHHTPMPRTHIYICMLAHKWNEPFFVISVLVRSFASKIQYEMYVCCYHRNFCAWQIKKKSAANERCGQRVWNKCVKHVASRHLLEIRDNNSK